MARRVDPLIMYEALSCRITRSGEVALYHNRLDVPTRRLVTVALDGWFLEPEWLPTPGELLERAVASYLRLHPEQPLW